MDIQNPTSKGNYAMIAVTPAGGASDFKTAFIALYGSGKWKGWGSDTQIYYQ